MCLNKVSGPTCMSSDTVSRRAVISLHLRDKSLHVAAQLVVFLLHVAQQGREVACTGKQHVGSKFFTCCTLWLCGVGHIVGMHQHHTCKSMIRCCTTWASILWVNALSTSGHPSLSTVKVVPADEQQLSAGTKLIGAMIQLKGTGMQQGRVKTADTR